MMNDILEALEIIKTKMPNGELAIIQDRMENIESAQDDMKEDLRTIRKQLLDPEDGIVVRVNKNTEFRKKKEEGEKDYTKILDEHKELMAWKGTVTRILWIMFTAVAGIVVSLIFKMGG
jgi:hypothetical protein